MRGNDALGGSNTNTGLTASDVFYFGSAPADSGAGNSDAFQVGSVDEQSARNDPHGPGNRAAIDNPNDFNRDGLVNTADQMATRIFATNPATQLVFLNLGGALLLAAPQGSPASSGTIESGDTGIATALAAVATTSRGAPVAFDPLAPATAQDSTSPKALVQPHESAEAMRHAIVSAALVELDEVRAADALAELIDGPLEA